MLARSERRGGDPFIEGGFDMADFRPVLHRAPAYEPPVLRSCARSCVAARDTRGRRDGPAPDHERLHAITAATVPPPPNHEKPIYASARRESSTTPATGRTSGEGGTAVRIRVGEAGEPQGTDPVGVGDPEGSDSDRESSTSASVCATRLDRKTLRRNHSAPAGVRRAQRAGHAGVRRPEPAGARAFATTAVRILLEVLDRRRPVAQLNALCTPGLVFAVGSLVAGDHAPSRTLGSAVLGTVRLFQVEEQAAEMMATYQRGPRRLVVAGRIERGTATPWKMTALRVI